MRSSSALCACAASSPPWPLKLLIAREMEDLGHRQRATRERQPQACGAATQLGLEEPGNELTISTWRATPTGKPRHAAQLALSHNPQRFPGERGSSLFPLPRREGAEGEG